MQERPDELQTKAHRIETGYGKVYVRIGYDENDTPLELFIDRGDSGGLIKSHTEALGKAISHALQQADDPNEAALAIAKSLRGTRSPRPQNYGDHMVYSVPDAVGVALFEFLGEDIPTVDNDTI